MTRRCYGVGLVLDFRLPHDPYTRYDPSYLLFVILLYFLTFDIEFVLRFHFLVVNGSRHGRACHRGSLRHLLGVLDGELCLVVRRGWRQEHLPPGDQWIT